MKKFLIALFLMFIVTSAYAIPPMPGGGGGVIISTDCSTYIALGQLCQDTDDGKLYKGTGAAVVEIAAGSSGDIIQSGTTSNHQWGYFTADKTLAGKTITASKPVCSDANGDPAVCAGTEGVWQVAGSYLTSSNIASSISDSDTTHCPDGNSIYDALALKQNYSSVLAALAGIAITVDGNNVTFPGAVITTAADGSRIIATLNNTSAPSLSANTYGWYFYGEVPYINVDGVPKPAIQKVCKTITNPSDADNMLFHIAAAGTITKISGICVGGTSAVITLQDAGADGSGSTAIDDAITIDTDGANGGAISYAIHDGDIIKLDVGAVTGVVTQLMVCYE